MSNIINLTAGMQQSVLALQNTASLFNVTETHLSTGLAVNTALDNPLKYFAAQNNNFTASALSTLQSNMNQALKTIDAANNGITSITSLIQQAIALGNQAAGTSNTTTIASLSTQYSSILTQITAMANDSSYNGTDLISGTSSSMTVNFSPTNTSSSVTVSGVDATSTGLSLSTAAWTTQTSSAAAITALNTALTTLQTDTQTLSSNDAVIQARISFTTSMVNTLQQGSSQLTAADMNLEGANMLALQTQQALGTQALKIASQASQSVLNLFA